MTIAIGYEFFDKATKKWWGYLAADSQTTWGSKHYISLPPKPSFLDNNKVITASAGRAKPNYLIQLSEFNSIPSKGLPFNPKKPKDIKRFFAQDRATQKIQLHEYLNGTFSAHMTEFQKKHNSGEQDKGLHRSDITAIFMFYTHIAVYHCDHSVAMVADHPHFCIGSGQDHADSVLDVRYAYGAINTHSDVVRALRDAVLAASYRDDGCGAPAHVLRTNINGTAMHCVFDAKGTLIEPEQAKNFGALIPPNKADTKAFGSLKPINFAKVKAGLAI